MFPPSTIDLSPLVTALQGEFDRQDDPDALKRRLLWVVGELLQRDQDGPQLGQTTAAIEQFFAAKKGAPVESLRPFCKQVVAMTVEKRPMRAADLTPAAPQPTPPPAPAPAPTAATGANYWAREIIPPPPVTRHDDFADLLGASLVFRVRHVTTFFQRRSPRLERPTPPPFLLSPIFDERFAAIIVEQIVPAMQRVTRFAAQFEHAHSWKGMSTADFWERVEGSKALEERLLATWRAVWTGLKPGKGNDGKPVVPPALASLRKALAPGEPPAYFLPRVGDDVINLLVRLLSDLRDELEHHWEALMQICEQEAGRHPEVAAEAVAERFQTLPGRLGEFIAILCHYNLSSIDIAFLERIAKGSIGTIFLPGFLKTTR